jgi:hypothetical protein
VGFLNGYFRVLGLAFRHFYIVPIYKELSKMLKSEQTIEDIKKALLDPDFGKEKSTCLTLQNFIISVILVGLVVASVVLICCIFI